MEENFTGKYINTKGMTEKEIWVKIRHQVRQKYGIEHHEIQRWQLTDALVAEIVKLSSIPDVSHRRVLSPQAKEEVCCETCHDRNLKLGVDCPICGDF